MLISVIPLPKISSGTIRRRLLHAVFLNLQPSCKLCMLLNPECFFLLRGPVSQHEQNDWAVLMGTRLQPLSFSSATPHLGNGSIQLAKEGVCARKALRSSQELRSQQRNVVLEKR